MLQSRYFAAKYFSNRHLGGIPEKETVIITPQPTVATTRQSGGRVYGWDGWQHILKDIPKRKQQDEEVLAVLAMFAVLEDEDAGLI